MIHDVSCMSVCLGRMCCFCINLAKNESSHWSQLADGLLYENQTLRHLAWCTCESKTMCVVVWKIVRAKNRYFRIFPIVYISFDLRIRLVLRRKEVEAKSYDVRVSPCSPKLSVHHHRKLHHPFRHWTDYARRLCGGARRGCQTSAFPARAVTVLSRLKDSNA